MSNIDWFGIKNEYINTNISQRKLAEKHNISFNTLKDKAHREKWAEERNAQHNKIILKIQQKAAEKIANAEVSRIDNILNLSDEISEALRTAIEQLRNSDGDIDTYKMRQIVQSVKDLNEIYNSGKSIQSDKQLNINLNWERQ